MHRGFDWASHQRAQRCSTLHNVHSGVLNVLNVFKVLIFSKKRGIKHRENLIFLEDKKPHTNMGLVGSMRNL
jgi:hypothetical protein